MKNFCKVIKKFGNISSSPMLGAGGGLAAGLKIFCNAGVMSWLEYFRKFNLFNTSHDYVVTGEGRIDSQSFFGKVVGEISSFAAEKEAKIIYVCGSFDKKSIKPGHLKNIVKIVELKNFFTSLSQSQKNTRLGLKYAGREISEFLLSKN